MLESSVSFFFAIEYLKKNITEILLENIIFFFNRNEL